MESKLRQILLDDRIIDKVGRNSNNLPKVFLLHAPEGTLSPYIEYQIVSDRDRLYSEGEVNGDLTSHEVQIDIFTKGSYVEIRDIVKKVMAEHKFQRGVCGSMFENETKLYHYLLRYQIEEE